MKKRILAALLSVAMVAAVISSCGDKANSNSSSAGGSSQTVSENNAGGEEGDDRITEITLPISENKLSFSSWRVWSNDYLNNYGEVKGIQALEEKTNIHIDYTCVPNSAGVEKFGLLLASGEYTDLIEGIGNDAQFYPGGEDAAVAEGVYRDMTDAVYQYMPNYFEILKNREDVKEIAISDEGRNVGIYMLRACFNEGDAAAGTYSLEAEPAWQGMAIREDWLQEANMEIPVTIDELYNALVYFRDNHNAWMELYVDGTIGDDFILSAYGVTADFYLIDGGTEVGFGPLTEGYKAYCELMRDWYAEGLINPDFTATASTVNRVDNSYFANGQCAVGMAWQGTIGRYFQQGGYVASDDPMYLAPMCGPVLNKGDSCLTTYQSLIACMPTWVTTAVTDEELPYLAQWMDYHYTYDYLVMQGYGVEGVSYNIDASSPWYFVLTDKVTHPETAGQTVGQAKMLYALSNNLGLYDWKSNWQTWELVGNDWSQKAYECWANQTDEIMLPMNASLTADESNEYTSIYADIESYVQEHTVKFIIGTEDIDATWDSFVKKIESMNIARCIELKQASVDRYYGKVWRLENR